MDAPAVATRGGRRGVKQDAERHLVVVAAPGGHASVARERNPRLMRVKSGGKAGGQTRTEVRRGDGGRGAGVGGEGRTYHVKR